MFFVYFELRNSTYVTILHLTGLGGAHFNRSRLGPDHWAALVSIPGKFEVASGIITSL